ncbi:hypothetical protein JHK82_027594 [Glycine max]|nr:hypothetical protein JHK86_027721 [Glycine max]KAG5126759.1 hypothetical protein JHK82_027594 [Glycine max]KAG5151370.1 hypothetical protein JHK84_027842 [Glycine max]
MRFHFYLFSPWTEKGVTFRNNMIHRAVLKNKGNFVIHNSNLIDGMPDQNNGDVDETQTGMDM